MSARYLATVVVLLVWAFFGPLAVAFGGCAGMGAICEGPCGTTPCAGLIPASAWPAPPVSDLKAQPPHPFQTSTLKVLDLPPK